MTRAAERKFLPAIKSGTIEAQKLRFKQNFQKKNPVAEFAKKNVKIQDQQLTQLQNINRNLKAQDAPQLAGGGSPNLNEVDF